MKIRYLAGNPTLVDFNLLDLSGILSSKETRQQALRLLSSTPPVTVNRVPNAQAQPPLMGHPQTRPSQTPPMTSYTYYPPPRGVPWKCIAVMVRSDTSCPGYHFNKPDNSPASSSTKRLDSYPWQSTATYSGRTAGHRRQYPLNSMIIYQRNQTNLSPPYL